MLDRLKALFEEDVAMQDAIEDADSFVDDAEDLVVDVIERERVAAEEERDHLFDGPEDKVAEPYTDLVGDDEDIPDEDLADDAEDDLIDDAIKAVDKDNKEDGGTVR